MFSGIFGGASSSGEAGEQNSFDIWSLAEKAKASLAVAVNSAQEVVQTIKDTNWNQELSSFSEGVKEDADSIVHPAEIPQSSEPVEKVIGNIGQELNQLGMTLLAGTKDMIEQLREGIDDEMATAAKQLKKKPGKVPAVSSAAGTSSIGLGSPKIEKAYSRYESEVAALQRDTNTYLDEPEEFAEEFEAFKASFSLQSSKLDIEQLLTNSFMSDLHSRIVPDVVEEEDFWSRYFFKVQKLKQKEEQRAQITQRVAGLTSMQQEEEEPWDDVGEENPPPPAPPVVLAPESKADVVDPVVDSIESSHVVEEKSSVIDQEEVTTEANVDEVEVPTKLKVGEDEDKTGPTPPDRQPEPEVSQPAAAALRKSTVHSDDSFKSWEKVDPSEEESLNQRQEQEVPEAPRDLKDDHDVQTTPIIEKKSERTTQTTPGLASKPGGPVEGEDWADWD